MKFHIYRDLASIAFVRCTSPVAEAGYNAEGVAFQVGTAIERCRSEVLEREFHLKLNQAERASILGIAAHPNKVASAAHAWNEVVESKFLEQLAIPERVSGFKVPLPSGGFVLVSRFASRWVCLLCFPHDGSYAVVQAASLRLVPAMLKAWTELRNIKLYKPGAGDLPLYTKGNRLLQRTLPKIQVRPGLSKNYLPPSQRFTKVVRKVGRHFITYYKEETI
jgi:hypothetical protein